MKNLSTEIKAIRESAGLSQMSMAVRFKVSIPTVQRWEKGDTIDYKVVVPLLHLARQSGRLDMARAIKNALLEDLGSELVEVIREKDAGEIHGIPGKETTSTGKGDKRRISA